MRSPGLGIQMNHRKSTNDLGLVDLVQESVVVFGMDGHIRLWNAASEHMYGWTRGEVLGRNLRETLCCSPGKPSENFQKDILGTGRWEGELTRVAKNGSRVFVRAVWFLRRDEDGYPKDVVETCVDLTAARGASKALRDAECRCVSLFQAAGVSIWDLDVSELWRMVRQYRKSGVRDVERHLADNPQCTLGLLRATRVLAVNGKTAALFGIDPAQAAEASLERFWPHESMDAFAEGVVAALHGHLHYVKETPLRDIAGRKFDALLTASFSALGQSHRLLAGVIDISAASHATETLEESEQRYRGLFQFMPMPLWRVEWRKAMEMFSSLRADGVINLDAYLDKHLEFSGRVMDAVRIVEVNRRAVDLFKAKNENELLGPLSKVWKDSGDAWRKLVVFHFGGGNYLELEVKLRALDDCSIDVLYLTGIPSSSQDQGVAVWGIIIDIGDRVRARETLAQLQVEFAHASRISTLGELTASIAHEVNQPLTAIVTNGEASLRWLNRPKPDLREVRTLTERMVTNARRADDVIRRIRAMASPTGTAERTLTGINSVIEEAALFLASEFHRHTVVATLDLAPDLPDVLADRIQLQQVVVNLAVNAVHVMTHAGSRNRRLVFRTSRVDPRTLRVEVEDTGPGIPAEHLGHLFKSFFTTRSGGMGMGLSICRSIIDAHGGTLSAANRSDGPGASFQFLLPV
jgi:PAS domain S-box-containing protein